MRCFRVALQFVRFGVAAAVAVFVCCGPAAAHSYRHSQGHAYHHAHWAHYARHRVLPMQANGSAQFGLYNSANGYGYAWSGNSARYGSYGGYENVSTLAASQAGAAGLPASLVERVIRRESGGNPRAVHAGNYGLMQIRLGTARAMGYTGSAAGLLDAQTNMTYALRYLAGAYRAAGGNENRAIALYARGYYYQAKAQGFSPYGFSPYASGTTAPAWAPAWGYADYNSGLLPSRLGRRMGRQAASNMA
jgi:soluble lytic murein transglycosylase-like protein